MAANILLYEWENALSGCVLLTFCKDITIIMQWLKIFCCMNGTQIVVGNFSTGSSVSNCFFFCFFFQISHIHGFDAKSLFQVFQPFNYRYK